MTYTFQRGETVLLALDCVSGDPASVSAVSAAMKPVAAGRSGPDGAAAAVAFDVTTRAAAGDVAAGWTLTIAASASASLAPGSYMADARFVVGSGVVISEPVTIRIVDSVSGS